MNKFIKNDYIFTFINKFSNIIFGIITSIFITRYSGAVLKGEYAIITNTLSIYALFANLGIYQAYPKYKRCNCDNILNKFVNLFYMQFILLLIIGFICSLFKFESLVFMLLPLVVLSNQLNFVVMVEDVFYKNKINILSNIVKLLYAIFIYFFCERNILLLVGSLVIVDIFLDIIYIFRLKVKLDITCLKLDFVYEIVKYSFIPMLSSLLMTLNYKFDILMLDIFGINTFNIGQYSLAVTLAGYGWLVPDIFKEVLFSKTVINDSSKEVTLCLKISNLACIIMIFGVLILGYPIIIIMYGKEFSISYLVTLILFIGIPAMSWFKIISTLYLAQGRRMFYFYVLLLSTIFNVGLNILLIPNSGIYGAALASVFSYTLCGSFFLFNYSRNYRLKIVDLFKFDKKFFQQTKALFSREV